MFTFNLQVEDNGLIAAYKELLSGEAEAFIRLSTARDVNAVLDKTLRLLRTPPGPVRSPLRWTSERQRRAFFASEGFGRGIPTRRSGTLTRGWRAFLTYAPGQLAEAGFENDVPYRQWVTGDDQQLMHSITGWVPDTLRFEEAQAELADRVETSLIKGWYAVG